MKLELKGLVAATFSPMHRDGSLNLDQIKPLVEHLIADGVNGMYVCGSTGEGPLLTAQERMAVAEAYVKANDGRLPVIVHVGHDSLWQARELAAHAQAIAADAIAAIPPTYFGVNSEDTLLDSLAQITQDAPRMPFFYYHVPHLTNVKIDLLSFLKKSEKRLPTLVGVKYTASTVFEFQSLLRYKDGKYTVLYGFDEMLSSALSVGAYGAIGSTFNFAAPLYRRIIDAHEKGDAIAVAKNQYLSVKMIRTLKRHSGIPAFKALMGLLGLECGPARLPLQALENSEIENMKRELTEIGFFEWARG